ncbi:MAG: Bax inhibitor-1/YccA family protein [Bacteroidota bacterium]
MNDFFDESVRSEQVESKYRASSAANEFLRQVFVVMGLGLLITGLTAWFFAQNIESFAFLYTGFMRWVVMLAPLGFVIYFSARFHKMSYTAVNITFASYAMVNGISLAFIFLVYSLGSVAQTFFITAGTFGVMALIGMTTKMDLTKMGSYLYMALIGIIIAMVVNFFLQSSLMDYIISIIGVIVFSGLTAYDVQKLMRIGSHADMESENTKKFTVMGALMLYLDFINLFLFLLRFFGSRD